MKFKIKNLLYNVFKKLKLKKREETVTFNVGEKVKIVFVEDITGKILTFTGNISTSTVCVNGRNNKIFGGVIKFKKKKANYSVFITENNNIYNPLVKIESAFFSLINVSHGSHITELCLHKIPLLNNKKCAIVSYGRQSDNVLDFACVNKPRGGNIFSKMYPLLEEFFNNIDKEIRPTQVLFGKIYAYPLKTILTENKKNVNIERFNVSDKSFLNRIETSPFKRRFLYKKWLSSRSSLN